MDLPKSVILRRLYRERNYCESPESLEAIDLEIEQAYRDLRTIHFQGKDHWGNERVVAWSMAECRLDYLTADTLPGKMKTEGIGDVSGRQLEKQAAARVARLREQKMIDEFIKEKVGKVKASELIDIRYNIRKFLSGSRERIGISLEEAEKLREQTKQEKRKQRLEDKLKEVEEKESTQGSKAKERGMKVLEGLNIDV